MQSQIFTNNNSIEYDEKINSIQEQFHSVLEDFKKYYVFYNKNPEVNEYQHFFMESKSQLEKLNKDILMVGKNIENNVQIINKNMVLLNKKIGNEKKLNGELLKLMNNLNNTQNGSGTMINDSKYNYNEQYYKNISFFLSILISFGIIHKLFTPLNN